MLPIDEPRVEVTDLYDDNGRVMWVIKVIASGAELTVGRCRNKTIAELQAYDLRNAIPGSDD